MILYPERTSLVSYLQRYQPYHFVFYFSFLWYKRSEYDYKRKMWRKILNNAVGNGSNMWNENPVTAYLGRQPFMWQQKEKKTWSDQEKEGGNNRILLTNRFSTQSLLSEKTAQHKVTELQFCGLFP